jgi:MFS family permease
MLATVISKQFFPEDSGTSALLSTLAIFAAGFIVRPFGALVFGRLGDLIGRKYTFLLTLVLMGGSTFAIGLVPGFKTIGWAAPILYWCFASYRGSLWVVNMAVPLLTLPNMRRQTGGVSGPAGYKQLPHWDCSLPLVSSYCSAKHRVLKISHPNGEDGVTRSGYHCCS